MTLAAQPPLPAPPVLTPPLGWLGFLGMKSGGSQPGLVTQYLSTTFEMLPFYVAGARSRLVSPGAGVAAVQNGAALLGTVPNGKVWIVEQAFASGTLGVAGGVDCQFLYTDSGPITFYAGPIERNFAASNKISARSDRLVVCGPGSKIFVTSNSAVAFTAFTWFPEIQGFEVSA